MTCEQQVQNLELKMSHNEFFFHLCQKKTRGDQARRARGSNVANPTTIIAKPKKQESTFPRLMQPQAFFSDETWRCKRTNTDPKGKRVLKRYQPIQTYYFQ